MMIVHLDSYATVFTAYKKQFHSELPHKTMFFSLSLH